MTDNDIIKALEWHTNDETHCSLCPYEEHSVTHSCVEMLISDALDLINRKNAEIERLKKTVVDLNANLSESLNCFTRMETLYKIKCKELEVATSEAIKEFADKVDHLIATNIGVSNQSYNKLSLEIKLLVEEMESNANE